MILPSPTQEGGLFPTPCDIGLGHVILTLADGWLVEMTQVYMYLGARFLHLCHCRGKNMPRLASCSQEDKRHLKQSHTSQIQPILANLQPTHRHVRQSKQQLF